MDIDDIDGKAESSEEIIPKSEPEQSKTDDYKVIPLKGMFENYFLDYASYVILERAVPYIEDGLKPVQRRVLHSMKEMDDGRYNKVANVVGNTMKYHPHGDASIYTTLVNLGQKDLLIDCQGNWGNVLTGDGAAAGRYIEARLSKFAGEVVFNPKTTEWQLSYDGRNREPVTLPVKFPLLLAQGVDGIAVGLACKILPHNFNELIDASIAHLRGEDFELVPDFQTGGMIDCSKYNDGVHGGKVLVRAKISQIDKKTLVINEIPYGETTGSVIDTIVSASEKGKIKIKKVDDNTAEHVEIVIHLNPGVSPDQTIDALYAFTNCQVSISPNSCVIVNQHPEFMGVKQILRYCTEHTKNLLRRELEIRLEELESEWHGCSLEKIFIENRIYNSIEECETWESVIETIDKGLEPFKHLLRREVTTDDIVRLTEIKIKRISKFNSFKADDYIKGLDVEIEEVTNHLAHLVDYAINFFTQIKKKFGQDKVRRTEIRSFDVISAVSVAANNEKLYVNKADGFICTGAGLKKEQDKDSYEFITDCSDLDDVIVFRENATFTVCKLMPKFFVGQNIIHVEVFQKNNDRTIYNMIYRDGKAGGTYFVKRFAVKGIVKDKEYDVSAGTPDSKVVYFSANPNGEAEMVKVILRPKPKLKKTSFEYNFADIAIKGRNSRGNILTRNAIKSVVKREDGISTLGARDIWYDDTVKRLNVDKRGEYLGAFAGDDKVLQIMSNGDLKLTGFDLNTHFDDDMIEIRKFDSDIMTVIYLEGESQQIYLKRFAIDEGIPSNNRINFVGDNENAKLLVINYDALPRLLVKYADDSKGKPVDDDNINVSEFVPVRSFKAKGRRLSSKEITSYEFIEPFELEEDNSDDLDEVENTTDVSNDDVNQVENTDTDIESDDTIIDEHTGQMELF